MLHKLQQRRRKEAGSLRFADFKSLQRRLDAAESAGKLLQRQSTDIEESMPALVLDIEYFATLREKQTMALQACWPDEQRRLDETAAEVVEDLVKFYAPTVRSLGTVAVLWRPAHCVSHGHRKRICSNCRWR